MQNTEKCTNYFYVYLAHELLDQILSSPTPVIQQHKVGVGFSPQLPNYAVLLFQGEDHDLQRTCTDQIARENEKKNFAWADAVQQPQLSSLSVEASTLTCRNFELRLYTTHVIWLIQIGVPQQTAGFKQ